MSWRLYCYGLRYLGRAHIRELLGQAHAGRIAAAVDDAYKTAVMDLRRLVEVPPR